MKTTPFVLLAAPLMLLAICFASATHAASVAFDWATVGNPGNAGELSGDGAGKGPIVTVGAVANTYRISKTEVTNAQYTKFLNAVDPTAANTLGLFNTNMAGSFGGIESTGTTDSARYIAQAGRENNPVAYVSWYDSVRFINWLDNGQPTDGSGTESGAYTLDGNTTTPTNGLSVSRSANATYWLPSEDEWYKAAYYDPNKLGGAGYYDYANGSDSIPLSDRPGDDPAGANYFNNDNIANGFNDGHAVSGSNSFGANPFTDVGAYTDATSPYGTYDQNGNVGEWNEGLVTSSARILRGGAWSHNDSDNLAASFGGSGIPTLEIFFIGFRVATIPEPSTILLGAMSAVGLLMRRIRPS